MTLEIVQAEGGGSPPGPSREIEFALMLSRVIDSVESNPEFLRATVYELARHKLKEEFGSEDRGDLSKSLETAIASVEAFSKKDGLGATLLGANPAQTRALLASYPSNPDVTSALNSASPAFESHAFGSGGTRASKKSARYTMIRWAAGALAVGLTLVSSVVLLQALRNKGNVLAVPPPASPNAGTAAPPAVAKAVETKPAAPSPTLPTSFGIYAVSNGKLYELDVLPGRAPDPRIAISSIITTPSRATLPDGRVSFVIYRRDLANTVADRAELRVIARIEREASFGSNGKQVVTGVDDNWVMRNISIPQRTAPVKDNLEMYEVRSENPDVPLSPGRYALVLKGFAYDFTVAGAVTDPRQCLERLIATNGKFYSECKK